MFFSREEYNSYEDEVEDQSFQIVSRRVLPPINPLAKKARKVKESKFEWKDDVVEKLIELWENLPLLYDAKHPSYHIKERRRNCIAKIVAELSEFGIAPLPSLEEVQRKLNALRSYFVAEKNKGEQSKVSGAGTADIYKSKWQYYDALSFLSDNVTPRATTSNICTKRPRADEDHCAYPTDNRPSAKSAKMVETNRSNDLIETAIKVLNRPKERPKPVEPRPPNSADQLFGEMIVKMLETIQEGESKDLLKMDIQRLIFETKYKAATPGNMYSRYPQQPQQPYLQIIQGFNCRIGLY